MVKIQHFHLNRLVDESGMSGLGKVAEGVILPNGAAVMWWLVRPHSIQIYRTIDDLHFIHRHGTKNTTELVMDD
jgi:hypothetical protein